MNKGTQSAIILLSTLFGVTAFSQDQLPASPADGFDIDRVPLLTVVPDYPRNAKRDRIEGEVQVCFNIDREGKTLRVAVRNSTHRIFEKPSTKAVRDSTYRPLPKDVVVPGIKTCRTFRFFLEPVAIDKLDGPDETSG